MNEKIVLVLALVAFLISGIAFSATYYSLAHFKEQILTGYATSTGTVNITVTSQVAINFTTNNINWGSGAVNPGATIAVLSTATPLATAVINGSWNNITQGFILQNIGNDDVNLTLSSGKNSSQFIGGTAGGGPSYQYNVSNSKASSCQNTTVFNLGQWYDLNSTSPGTNICMNFSFVSTKNQIRIDIKLGVPSDSVTGNLSDTITATGTGL